MYKSFFTLFLLGMVMLSKAQHDSSIPDPEFINQVYVLGKDHKLQSLEKIQVEMKTKSKMGGMAGAKQLYLMEGAKSIVVLPSDDLTFLISTGGGSFGMDPSSQYELVRFETKKNDREAIAGTYGGRGKSKDNQNAINLNFKKLKEGVFGMVPDKKLDPGEYAFINKMSMQGGGMTMKLDAFAFSVQ